MAPIRDSFRAAMGRLPVGVTVVTSVGADGEPVGATVSAFMSLSLEPTLVVVSLMRESRTAMAIEAHGAFAVHLVADDQCQLAMRFASNATDKFDGVEHGHGTAHVPALYDFDTRLDCRLYATYPGGDHLLFVGEVEHVDCPAADSAQSPASPVAWYRGAFRRLVDSVPSNQ